MNYVSLLQVVVLALATAAISLTAAKGRIFAPVRTSISIRSEWLGKLASCPYCTSHWVAIALVAIYRPVLIPHWIILDLILSVFVTVAISAVVSGMIQWLSSSHSEMMQEDSSEEIEQLRAALQVARDKLVEQADLIKQL